MGGTLTLWLATRHPELAGIALVNALAEPPGDLRQLVDDAVAGRHRGLPRHRLRHRRPRRARSPPTRARRCGRCRRLLDAVEALQPALGVDRLPGARAHVARRTTSSRRRTATTSPRRSAGPVERVTLERSYHVATLDYDKALIEERIVDFATKVTA